jgi:predicted TPR repeat methyltransferase
LLPIVLTIVVLLVLAGAGVALPTLLVDVIGHLLAGRPDDVEGWCYYGNLLDKSGHQAEAAEAYRKALILKPDYTECWKKLGNLLERMGDINGASEAYGFAAS